jgi:ATP-dependent DNA helicase
MRQDSAQPSVAGVNEDVKMELENGNDGQSWAVENEEDMDVKTKALMHLLNTSEVCHSWEIHREPVPPNC